MENTGSEEKVLEERKKKVKDFLLNNKIWVFIALFLLLILVWHTRTANVPNLKDVTTGDYTLGPDLDPFLFLRYAEYIVEHGKIMPIDFMRYVPLGYDTSKETVLLSYFIAYFHKALNFFSSVSMNYSAVMFPVFMFLLTAIAFFLFVRKIFEEKGTIGDIIALVSTAFLIVSPAILPRTVAGIPEKESVGFLFLFLSFYLFLCSWKSKDLKKGVIFGFLAGLSTAIMGLLWGGWIYIFITIGLFAFINFIFGKIDIKRFISYFVWLGVSFLVPVLFSQKYSLISLLTSTSTGISFMALCLIAVDFIIFKTRIKDLNFVKKIKGRIPSKIFSIIVFLILIFIAASLFFGVSFIPSFIYDISSHLTTPYSDRLSFTVAENRQPYFSEWRGSFGPIIFNIPLFFWLFFIGSIFLFYEIVKDIGKKEKTILTASYTIFLFCLIFSRYSPSSIMNGSNGISNVVYFGGFLVLAIPFLYVFYSYYKAGKFDEFKKINFSYLFLLAYFIPGIIGARSAIRLIMGLSPIAAALIGYFSVEMVERFRKPKDETFKMLTGVIAILVIIATLYTFYYDYNATIGSAKSMIPSIYTQQWQKAMFWVRENTPKDAVFGHWWDYGYWVQSIGERATMLDGGNAIPYWDYLMGRYGLTAQNESEALELLYNHNVSYFLIDSSDIGKYAAYSSIGSDENYDRYSWIGTFLLNEQATQETKNETLFFYGGGVALDEDLNWQDNGNEVFFPSGRAGVGALILSLGKNNEINQPQAIFVYQNKQYTIPLRYLYYENKLYDFKSGYWGALYIFPKINQAASGGISVNDRGAALFLSERNVRALWVRLYLLNEGERFKLVYSEQNFLVENLRQQGLNISDIVYYNDVYGPIKIWKVEYVGNEEINPEYLQTSYPEKIQNRRVAR